MIKIYQKTITKSKPKELAEFKVGSWVYVESPTEAEIEKLTKDYSLDEGHLKDALDPFESPRLESEVGTMYVYIRVPTVAVPGDYEKIETSPLLVIIGKDFFMTVATKTPAFFEKFMSGKVNFVTTQKTRMLLQMFAQANLTYSDMVTRINRSVRGMSTKLERIESKDIARFVHLETVLNDFLSALVPMSAILNTILAGKQVKLYEEDKDLTEDLTLGNNQLIEICRSNLKTIVNIREAYSTLMTHELNSAIRLLTVLTVVLTVPTLVASLFGMNVTVPYAESQGAFVGIVLLIILVSAGLWFWFRKNLWF